MSARAPKAELHVHLEGTAPPALARRSASRDGLAVPPGTIRADVAEPARRGLVLECCPTSDVALGVYPTTPRSRSRRCAPRACG